MPDLFIVAQVNDRPYYRNAGNNVGNFLLEIIRIPGSN